jgi:preprotein translocase subunit YajC
MDANGIISLISNVGFPVAVCVALFFYMEKQNERHQNETDKLNATVQSNTKVLTELCTLIKTLIK